MKYNTIKVSMLLIFVILFNSCEHDYTPKPRGYFRIDFPKKEYVKYDDNDFFSFETPVYSKILKKTNENSLTINYISIKAQIFLTYFPLKNNFNKHMEEARSMVYKHSIKADAIGEQVFLSPEKKVYGILYKIKGNAASNYQFFLSDSVNHFVRAALYFNASPNKDSLKPVNEFIVADILKLIESFEWKKK